MIVADASGLMALGSVGVVDPFVDEFDVGTTEAAIEAIEEASARHGPIGEGARAVLAVRGRLQLVAPDGAPVETSRLDEPAGSCVALARDLGAPFLVTDERRALHELGVLVPGQVVTPPIALAALVRRGTLIRRDAWFRLDARNDRLRGLEAALGDRAMALVETADG